ncbi:MAG: hypothetical protein M0T71_14195 [Actinomycetota bacterium]|nr:hypothetical protein [Actinomycetota bacterium]
MGWREVDPRLVVRQLAQPLHAPAALAGWLHAVHRAPPAVDLVAVYRRRNAARVARLVARAPAGTVVHLWALDEPAEALAAHTVGTGPGDRPALLNRLAAAGDPARWLLACDDDVDLGQRALGRLCRLAERAELDVCQPAHLARSYASWPFNRQRLWPLVRRTRFVEQGPCLLLSPAGRRALVPLPEDLGMGWGLEAHFATAAGGRLQLGVVDAVGMRHRGPVAAGYGRDAADAHGRRALSSAGIDSYGALQVVLDRWVPWQRRPGWTGGGSAG